MNSNNSKTAAFIDMDFTLYSKFLYQGMFAHHRQNNFKPLSLIKFGVYHFIIWLLSQLGLVTKKFLHHQHATNLAWLVKGVTKERADLIWDWVLENEIIPYLRPEMIEVIDNHKQQGHRIVLCSGSYTPILNKVVDYLGLEKAIATPLEAKKGKYTGRIIPPLNMGQGKVERIITFLKESGGEIDLKTSYFYSDSIMDFPVMELVGYPVAVYPDEILAEKAKTRNWQIIGSVHKFE